MKKIGLIGGLSWVSTAQYYKRLNEITQQVRGGVHSAPIVLESVDRQLYVDAVINRQDEGAACDQILAAAKGVERAGAAFIVISCNDVHRFVPQIEPELSIPFLHIAEATAREVKRQRLGKVSLLGVMKTMEGTFYQDVFDRHGLEIITPDQDDRDFINARIMDEMVANIFTDETRTGYLKIINRLAESGAEGVILGCTEIPLLLHKDQIPYPSFSTTELHCQAAIELALRQ